MTTLTLPLRDVWAGDRLREVDEDWAAVLAASMREQGQMAPIEVRETPGKIRPYGLVAGAHRLRALELNGADTVVAVLFEGDEVDAKLREIDENLMRHELSALDRATFLAERKAVYEELHPATKHGGDRRSDQVDSLVHLVPRFTKATAERLGLDERTIRRAVRQHAALHADVRKRLTGTWLANSGQQLDLLAAYKHDEQIATVDLLFTELSDGAKRPKSVGEALDQLRGVAVLPGNKDEAAFATFASLWRKGSPALRRRIGNFVSKESKK